MIPIDVYHNFNFNPSRSSLLFAIRDRLPDSVVLRRVPVHADYNGDLVLDQLPIISREMDEYPLCKKEEVEMTEHVIDGKRVLIGISQDGFILFVGYQDA